MALFEIDESSGLPVWVQLRNRFVYLIKTGHYQPGDQLPSVRTLAAEAAINYIKRCLALGMTLDEIMLRMIDVAHRVQQDVEGGASMRRGLYEKSQRKESN